MALLEVLKYPHPILRKRSEVVSEVDEDIKKLVQDNLDKEKEQIEFEIEKLMRAYDPCMSCAAHFLKVKWIR